MVARRSADDYRRLDLSHKSDNGPEGEARRAIGTTSHLC